jgi:vacuolar-type H+-ATPase subunit D/Vma8
MSDEKLEEYLRVVEPKFNSHLGKGTIEMSNEYYNLLEEKMARLINQNQELKKQLDECKKETQQKEFIKWLEDEIEKATTNPYTKLSEYGMNRIHIYKEILQKYRSIIGGKDV